MGRVFTALFLCCSLAAGAEEERSYWGYHPLHVGANAIQVNSADVSGNIDTGSARGNLSFHKTSAYTDILVPITATSYFFPRVEWDTFFLDWDQNAKFHQTNFYYLQFALTFYSIGLEDWRWIARVDYNLDLQHFTDPSLYSLWSTLVWGAYQPHRKWHVHVGALGYTGFGGQEVYPVIGADYAPNKKWFFQFLFPINYSAEYNISSKWRLAAKIRPLKERFRAGADEPQPRSIFSYSSTGAEINAHYELPRRLEIELYGGYSFGGSFYIKDQYGDHAIYTSLGSAPYFGASLNFGF